MKCLGCAALLLFPVFAQEAILGWRAAAPVGTARFDHCAVSLGDGRVLVAGGSGVDGALDSVEIYGPENTFQNAARMAAPRSGHSCTLLEDGRVIVYGGAAEPSAEIYNPETNEWTGVEGGTKGRRSHTATPLIGGRVLFAGGTIDAAVSDLLEIYESDTNTIQPAGVRMTQPRTRHVSVALHDGRVLISGGSGPERVSSTAEIYNPVSDSVTATRPMGLARADHGAAILDDGRVLIAGGTDGQVDLGNAEIYSASLDWFEWIAAPMITARRGAFVTTIRGSGLVLIAGGESEGRILGDTEVYAPWTNRFHAAAPLTAPRRRISGTMLEDGVVLATGGDTGEGPSRACGTFTVRSLRFSKNEYTPGETAVVSGSGFGSNVVVTLDLRRSDGTPVFDSGRGGRTIARSATTNASGSFTTNVIQVVAGDLSPVTSSTGPTLTGKNTFILRAQPAAGTITDGTSNTITFSETSEASYDAKAATRLLVSTIPSPSVQGATIPIVTTFSSDHTLGPALGKFSFKIGTIEKSRFGTGDILIGAPFTFNFCCQNSTGSHPVEVSFGGDNVYAKSSISIAGGHSVVVKQVTIGTTMQSLPLFTTVNVPIRVSVPAAIAPRPGGSISVSRSGMTTVTRTLSPVSSSSSIASTASFPFRATFSERPSACFSVEYATDGFYPSTTGSVCIPTGPAVTTLALSVPAKSYNFGQPFPITVNLTFPAELGILNRSVTINPVPGTVEMTPAVGQAGVILQPILPFNAGGLKASYGGGGDLASATAELELTMNPIATSLILQPIPASVSNPFTLRAEVRSAVPLPSAGQSALGGPVQFFDGELFIGSAPLAIGSDGVHRATLSNVIRPVGPRFIRVVYDGNKLFNGSKSTVVQTTVE